MPKKNHQQKITEIEDKYCRQGYKCKRNFQIYNPKTDTFDLIDLVCFKGDLARAFEIEVSGKQVLKNAQDLRLFKALFKKSKACQLDPSMDLSECPDFQKKIIKQTRF